MTILEAIQKSTDFLTRKGVDSPRLQSELLLAHVLKTQRLKLYLEFAKSLGEAETTALRELVQRRATREPLQHILGTASFCGLELKVNRNVLVPRPETELLAEQGWKFLNSLGRDSSFLDFGAGSGCIAIALCHFAKQARGIAIDRSTDALAIASANAARHSVESRIIFTESDSFAALDTNLRLDLVISNPPYIPTTEIGTLQEEVRNFDPHPALDGGDDGLIFYRLLAREAPNFLAPQGKLMVEFGDGQQEQLRTLFTTNGWLVESILNDLTDRPRILIAHQA
ncbi:MAG TPA: peptide chain release factor N(5)-glutamine methyltransferase [Verrucomicrobiae bacterium]